MRNEILAASVRRIGRRVVINATLFDAAIAGTTPDPTASPQFLSVDQIAERHPAFSPAAIRQMLAKAERAAAESSKAAA